MMECLDVFGISTNGDYGRVKDRADIWELSTLLGGYFSLIVFYHYFLWTTLVCFEKVKSWLCVGFEAKINHLLFTDNLKLFGNSTNRLTPLCRQFIHLEWTLG